jgi:hypothetical protein
VLDDLVAKWSSGDPVIWYFRQIVLPWLPRSSLSTPTIARVIIGYVLLLFGLIVVGKGDYSYENVTQSSASTDDLAYPAVRRSASLDRTPRRNPSLPLRIEERPYLNG